LEKKEKIIYLILALVITAWGLNVVMVKYLTAHIPPMLVASIRMLFAGIVFLPFVWKKYGFYKPTLKQWILLFLIGITSLFLHQLFLAYGIVTTTATNTSLMLGLNPLFTALLASIFIGEKFTIRLFIGILLGFSGVILVVTSKSADSSLAVTGWGDLIIFISMLAYVTGTLIVKKVSTTPIPTLVVTAYSTVIGAVLLNLASLVYLGPSSYVEIHFTATIWAIILISACGATSIGSLGWNHAIKLLGANRTAVFLNGMPFTSMVGGVIFLDEKVGWVHFAAFILTTLGILIGTGKQKDSGLPSLDRTSVKS
jgi:drug/metabolite transporter (DMT)-like permease